MVWIAMAGGAISGNWEIGSVRMASTPVSIRMIAMTHAKMGRSMKKRDMALISAGLGCPVPPAWG
jgi:hypothetical protein